MNNAVLRQISPNQFMRNMQMKVEVLYPASRPPVGPGAPVPDPRKVYNGIARKNTGAEVMIETAHIHGGQSVGNEIHGATYFTPNFPIPGLCRIIMKETL